MMQNNSTIIQTQAKLPVAPFKEAQLAISGQNQRDQLLLKKPLIGLKALADKALENHTENYFCQIAPKKTSNFLLKKLLKSCVLKNPILA